MCGCALLDKDKYDDKHSDSVSLRKKIELRALVVARMLKRDNIIMPVLPGTITPNFALTLDIS